MIVRIRLSEMTGLYLTASNCTRLKYSWQRLDIVNNMVLQPSRNDG